MTFLKRLRFVPVLLGVVATLVAVGSGLFGSGRGGVPPAAAPLAPSGADGSRFVDELAATKFSKMPVLTYQPKDGEMLFAWQIQPDAAKLGAQAPRPRDVLVVVDTTASQAGRPLKQAKEVIAALHAGLTGDDRVSVWTLSTPKATRALLDFQSAKAPEVLKAAEEFSRGTEYGSGAADLKGGLEKALKTFTDRTRHQVVLYLGDGESAFAPISEAERLALGTQMDMADQYFFAVPIGLKLDAYNLHGLATLTGGAVVRIQEDLAAPANRAAFFARLKTALDVPVVKPEKWKFGDEVGESYPTKIPPLRTDRSTLVMGKIAKGGVATVTATVNGVLNGKPVALTFTQPLPASQVDHFFLNLMIHQWRNAPHKDAPAMLQSDRALALASTQVKLYRNEFLTQAVWAVQVNQLDEAAKLYDAALKVDPTDREAVHGLALVTKMKTGKLTKAELEKQINEKVKVTKLSPNEAARAYLQEPGKVDPPAPPPGGVNPPPAAADLLREAAARRAIEEQRYKVLTDATIRRGRALLRTDPDAAYQDLKRQRDEIIGYEGIGDDARRQMVADLETVMREVFVKGAEIKRQADIERQAVARTKQRISEFDRLQDQMASDKNRVAQFTQLMQRARYELAYQEAQLMQQEKIVQGLPVPVTATASYIIGQQATQIREWKELVRIREDRFLLAMMQTEKSHIPYPDEPPVHFPPAAVWRELTGLRREAYLNSNLGNAPSETQKQLKSIIENNEVNMGDKNINEIPLFELLQDLSKKHGVTFVIMEEYFKAENVPNIKDEKTKIAATQLRGLKLGNFLDIVLLGMNATYIVRPDYIEITTFQKRLEEKVTRVFPVADLVIPIPSSVNQQVLFQNQQFQNQTLAIFGQASLFGGGLQNLGGNFGGPFGNNNGGNNPLNNQAFGGQQAFGGGAGQIGNLGNQGFGGGLTGFGGGQLGQFGNLGGQFGIQGGDQSGLLMRLIFETVARGEWANLPNTNPMPGMGMDDTPVVPTAQLNSLGYYPPARALIIHGSTRYHPASSIKLKKQEGGGGQAFAPGAKPGGGQVVIGPNTPAPPPRNPGEKPPAVAGAPATPPTIIAAQKPTLHDPKVDPLVLRQKLGNDPKTMWSDAIDWTVTDPGLIVACAEFLMEYDDPKAAAEVLKGNLRKGLATDEWAHEALVMALQASKADHVEVERAAVSAIDLDPTSAKAYLKAAKAESGLKNHAQAMVFCKRAAHFSPDDPTPYANAMAYAKVALDDKADVKSDAVMWAADNLLRRDWGTSDGIDYHKEVAGRLPVLATGLKATGQNTDALAKVISEQNERDLVIELLWQGNADLDLIVSEPVGSVCSAIHKRTTGGGVLKADILEQSKDKDRSEVYTAASAFSGTYKVSVKQGFGKPIGGKATLKVTKFKGTPREVVDLLDVELSGKVVEVKLDGGTRTTLAPVSEEINTIAADLRANTTGAPLTGRSGLGGGAGTAGSVMTAPMASTNAAVPVVAETTEMRVPGVAAGAADIRASYKLNPDRQTYSVTVNPVFSKGDIAMPKVPLLPGGEGK